MNSRRKKRNPAGARGFAGITEGLAALYGKSETNAPRAKSNRWQSPNLPRDWRNRLPDPAAYYSRHLDKLTRPNGSGFAQARCPFHEDSTASLSVSVTGKGGWKCFAGCGGGDLVSFHMRSTGKDFKAAVLELVGGGA